MNLEREIFSFLRRPKPEGFEDLAIRLYQQQREKNRPYDLYCRALGISVSSWKEIPGLPQQAFKLSEIRSFPAEQTQFEFRTSGTTGEGFGSHFFPSLHFYQEAVQRGWEYAGLPRYPIGLLMPNPTQNPYSSLARMGAFLAEETEHQYFWRDPGYIDAGKLRDFVERGRRPVVLFGTALAFLDLLESTGRLESALPERSLVMETGGFKGSKRVIEKGDLYRRLSDYFRIPVTNIWNEYGMTELSSQFYTSGIDRPHVGPPWTRVVVVDPVTNREAESGETGMVRIIDLANVWSVLAIQTQDLAQRGLNGEFRLLGRDPNALPRGCSRAVDEILRTGR